MRLISNTSVTLPVLILSMLLAQPSYSQPQIVLDPERLEIYGEIRDWNDEMPHVPMFDYDPQGFAIRNTGDEPLIVENIVYDQDEFDWLWIEPNHIEIAAGGVGNVGVELDMSPWGEFEVPVIIVSNDPERGELEYPIAFDIYYVPWLGWDPPFGIEEEIYRGEVREYPMRATNNGEEELHIEIGVEVVAEPDDGGLLISIEPGEGVMQPWERLDVVMTVDAREAVAGDYEVNLIILTNNPDEGVVEIICIFYVTSRPVFEVVWDEDAGYPDIIDWNHAFEEVFWGGPYEIPIFVSNAGDEELEVTDITCEIEEFTAEPTEFSLAPGEAREVTVTFETWEPGDYNGVMTIFSNDPDAGEFRIDLHAQAFEPPNGGFPPMIEDDLFTGEISEHIFVIENPYNEVLRFFIIEEILEEPDRDNRSRNLRRTDGRIGPRRDQPESHFALFKDQEGWGDQMEAIWQQEEADMDQYGSDAFDDFPIDEYDAIWIREFQSDAFNNAWNASRERFEEWVAQGGALYHGSGTNNWNVPPIHVGGFSRLHGGAVNGTVAITNDEQAENYNYLAELVPWEGGERLPGNSWLHARYTHQQFEQIDDSDYYQVIAHGEGNPNLIGVAVYNFGRGWSIVSGTTDSYQYINWRHQGQWGDALDDLILYLDFLANYHYWLIVEPTEGEIEPGGEALITVTLDATGLIGGAYEAELHVSFDNPRARDMVVPVLLWVEGAPDIEVEWSEDFGYPELIDWNLAYEDLYTGGPYEIPVTIMNAGSEDLLIEDIFADHDYFSADFEGDVSLDVDDEIEVTFIFNAPEDDPDEYNGVMTIFSNDPDEEEFTINLHAEVLEPPVIVVEPEEIEEWMLTGQVDEHELVISNEGGSLLRFDIEHEIIREIRQDKVRRGLRRTDGSTPYRDRRGEPDDMGYEWRDSDEDDGPEFEWINRDDYEGIREFRLADDQNTGRLDLGWTYPFWDREFDRIYGNSDGWASFTYAGNAYSLPVMNWPVAAEGQSAQTICLRQVDHLDGTEVWFWTNEDDQAIIWWAGNHRENFQLIIDETGMGTLQIGENCPARNAGVNLGDGRHGWGFGSYADGSAVAFGPPGAWLDWVYYEPSAGEIAPGEEMVVTVTLDARGLYGGEYEASLLINSNDPVNPTVEVVINVMLEAPWGLWVYWSEDFGYPDLIDFNGGYPETYVGRRYTVPVEISNDGVNDLIIEAIECDNEAFHAEPDNLEIEAGEDGEITLFFEPEEAGESEGIMTISSNDPDIGEWEVWLHAEAEELPELRHFTDFVETEVGHRILVTDVQFRGETVPTGWEIGVFTPDDVLSGGAVWTRWTETELVAWGAEEDVEQFETGDAFTFGLWDPEADREFIALPEIEEGPELWIPNGLTVLSLNGFDGQLPYELHEGWNLISINVVPSEEFWVRDEGPDVRRMMEQFRIDEFHHHLILMKDEQGRFYAPMFDDWTNIPYWNLTEGYQMKVDEDIDAFWTGAPIPPEADIPIESGWNMIAYFPEYELPCLAPDFYAFESILDHLLLAKDNDGNFCVPEYNYSNMPPLEWGQGYQVKTDADVVLNYPPEQEELAYVSLPTAPRGGTKGGVKTIHWQTPSPTGVNMSVLVTLSSIPPFPREDKGGIDASDQVAAFNAENRLVGVETVDEDGRCGLAVWGDDPTTEEVDGLREGELFSLRLWDENRKREIELTPVEILTGNGLVYETDGLVVLKVAEKKPIPEIMHIAQNYPNPFNSTTRISFGLPEACPVSVKIYDLSGRYVTTLVNGRFEAGHHEVAWDAADCISGIYMVQIEAQGVISVQKVTLMR